MSQLRNFCLFSLLLSLLVFAGCSSDEETSLLEPTQPEASIDLYADFNSVLREYGVDMPTSEPGDKYVPLPAPLLFAVQASGAKNAVETGTTWEPLTEFIIAKQGYVGYGVAWLEPIPDSLEENAYYVYHFGDKPVNNPKKPEEVDPFVEPVEDSIDRVSDVILYHPELATERVYESEGPIVYYYKFVYPVRNTFHTFRMSKVRMIIED